MEQDVRTMSVRQLATLFDRSDQTVRRWKDKGINGVRLQSGDEDGEEETRGGTLVFTVDAVRAFVDKNPNLLDKAAPELELILYGRKRGIFSRRKTGRDLLDLTEQEDETPDGAPVLDAPPVGRSRAIVADDGDYMLRLLEKREEEIREEICLLNRELEQIEKQKRQFLD